MTTGTDETYAPAAAAARTGLSLDTLRYYERIGLLRAVPRTAGGRRRYRGSDLDVLSLMSCLRDTGMPVRDMRRYAALLHEGDATEPARLALLREHRAEVDRRIARLEAQAARIDAKIAYYEGA